METLSAIRNNEPTTNANAVRVDMKLEVVIISVSDVDRAKEFYARLGWRLDADFTAGDDWRGVQFTPPGSGCSVIFGKNVTTQHQALPRACTWPSPTLRPPGTSCAVAASKSARMKHFDAIIIGTGQAGPSLAARFAARTRQSPSWTGPRRGRCANTCIRSNLHSALESDRYVVGEKSRLHSLPRFIRVLGPRSLSGTPGRAQRGAHPQASGGAQGAFPEKVPFPHAASLLQHPLSRQRNAHRSGVQASGSRQPVHHGRLHASLDRAHDGRIQKGASSRSGSLSGPIPKAV